MIGGTKVITHIRTKNVYLLDPNNRESITSIKCISRGGEVIPPMVIIVGRVMLKKHFNNSLKDRTLIAVLDTA